MFAVIENDVSRKTHNFIPFEYVKAIYPMSNFEMYVEYNWTLSISFTGQRSENMSYFFPDRYQTQFQ